MLGEFSFRGADLARHRANALFPLVADTWCSGGFALAGLLATRVVPPGPPQRDERGIARGFDVVVQPVQ